MCAGGSACRGMHELYRYVYIDDICIYMSYLYVHVYLHTEDDKSQERVYYLYIVTLFFYC